MNIIYELEHHKDSWYKEHLQFYLDTLKVLDHLKPEYYDGFREKIDRLFKKLIRQKERNSPALEKTELELLTQASNLVFVIKGTEIIEGKRSDFSSSPKTMPDGLSMHPVQSSNIVAAGYDNQKQCLYIRFKSNDLYCNYGVLETKYKQLLNSEAPGKYLNNNIKGAYQYARCR